MRMILGTCLRNKQLTLNTIFAAVCVSVCGFSRVREVVDLIYRRRLSIRSTVLLPGAARQQPANNDKNKAPCMESGQRLFRLW
jgi:hypothetical protein